MINTTQEIIDSLKKGKMVIIMDDENRENEGDLVIASEFVKPKDINFMASKGRGLICMTLTSPNFFKFFAILSISLLNAVI